MFSDMSLDDISRECDGAPLRYTICCESRSNDFFTEIGKFKNRDIAELCMTAIAQQFKNMDVTFTLDDVHAEHSFAEVLEAITNG